MDTDDLKQKSQPTTNNGHNLEDADFDEDVVDEDDLIPVDLGDDPENNDMEDEDDENGSENEDDMETQEPSQLVRPPRDDSSISMTKHGSPIFCISVGHTQESSHLCFSGGQDDQARLWDVRTGQELSVVTKHVESVIACGFCSDSSMVASADMAGELLVYRVSDMVANSEALTQIRTDPECLFSFSVGSELLWLDWHPTAPILLAGSSDGTVWLWHVTTGNSKAFSGPCSANQGHFFPDGKRAFTTYEDGSMRVWDLKSAKTTYSARLNSKSKPTSLALHKDNVLTAIGDESGICTIFNSQNGKILSNYDCNHKTDTALEDSSVEAVEFSHFNNLLITGCLNGIVTAWDLGSCSARAVWSTNSVTDLSAFNSPPRQEGQGQQALSPSQALPSTSSPEEPADAAQVAAFSQSSPAPSPILDGLTRLLCSERAPVVLSASRNGGIALWDLRAPSRSQPVRLLLGHAGGVYAIDWLANETGAVSGSDDGELKVFLNLLP